MKLFEEKKDIFTVDFNEYTIVHCISYDCKMGAGIAVPIKKYFNLHGINKYVTTYPTCVYYNSVLNLITKCKYWGKPTYETLNESLTIMKEIIIKEKITKIVMPKIGCGLDRLKWETVKESITTIFYGINIEILVCKL